MSSGSILCCDAELLGTRIRAAVDPVELRRYQGEFVLLGLANESAFREWAFRELCRVDAVDLPQPVSFSV